MGLVQSIPNEMATGSTWGLESAKLNANFIVVGSNDTWINALVEACIGAVVRPGIKPGSPATPITISGTTLTLVSDTVLCVPQNENPPNSTVRYRGIVVRTTADITGTPSSGVYSTTGTGVWVSREEGAGTLSIIFSASDQIDSVKVATVDIGADGTLSNLKVLPVQTLEADVTRTRIFSR